MRVFCPEHKRGFFAPRQSPIKCENKVHILGELDFAGEAKTPVALQWQYCCNCEHFCPVDFDRDGLERCPVCTRRSSFLYLCDRCYTISFESDTPLQLKNFTLTTEGGAHPSCPGCLNPTPADLYEHACDGLGMTFVTALRSCPVCEERLDIGPEFPSSVARYLKRTRSANKINVTFDYETELFVPVEDGEFVVIVNGEQHFLLPRAPRFATRREFYEFYQDYYHCSKPDAGEVHVVQPAGVVPANDGWRLRATGVLEVPTDQPPKKTIQSEVTRPQANVPVRTEQAPPIEVVKEEPSVIPCVHCGSLIATKYSFCWKCGHQLTSDASTVALGKEEDELTVQHEGQPVRSPLFSWASHQNSEQSSSIKGSVLKLLGVAVVGLLLGSVGLLVVTRSDTRMASVTAQPVAENPQPNPTIAPLEPTRESTPQRPSPVRAEDTELKKLREKINGATPSNRSTILQAFAKVEKQYPTDYRFPYERAKLAIKDSQPTSQGKAFKALSNAAEKAINTGKSREMLDGLEMDKAGDFNKLARSHEWARLLTALKSRNTGLLSARAQPRTPER